MGSYLVEDLLQMSWAVETVIKLQMLESSIEADHDVQMIS